MTAEDISRAQGLRVSSNQLDAVKQCLELHASGVFRRQQFLNGMRSAVNQLGPYDLTQTVLHCVNSGLFGFELLQALVPDPLQACDIIQQACHSRGSARQLLQNAQAAAVVFLQQLLAFMFGMEQTSDAHCGSHNDQHTALHTYLHELLQQLSKASSHNEVLTLCLFRAAAGCAALVDSSTIARWAKQQLHSILASITNHPQDVQVLNTKHGDAWATLFLRQNCWQTIIPIATELLGVQDTMQQLQQHLGAAVTTPQGLRRMLSMLAGVRCMGAQQTEAVNSMLSSMLLMSLKDNQLGDLLAAMLLAQHLLDSISYIHVLQTGASAALTADATSGGWPMLLRAMSLMLFGASLQILQAHVEVLQHLLPAAGPAMQQKVKEAVLTLQSAVAEKQQVHGAQQNSKPLAKLDPAMRNELEQFSAQPAADDGRRHFTQWQSTRWRMFRKTVPEWADALSVTPPETAAEARVRWEFLKALADINIGTINLNNKELDANATIQQAIGRLQQTCLAVGIDMLGGISHQTAATPLEELQQMLNRLPAAAAAAERQLPALRSLMIRMTQQLKDLLQQPQQPQQQGHDTNASEPARPAKRRCTMAAGAAVATAHTAMPRELMVLLMEAHEAALYQQGGSHLAWRLQFANMLQEVQELHQPLMQQILASIHGIHADGDQQEAVASTMAHAKLLALLAAAHPSEVQLLQPGSQDSMVQAETATSQYLWQMSAAANSFGFSNSAPAPKEAAVAACKTVSGQGQQLQHHMDGFAVLDWLVSHTAIETDGQVCFAAIFWTAYLIEVASLGCWCAGPCGPFKKASSSHTTSQHGLLGYIPTELLSLLNTLQQQLAHTLAQQHNKQSDADLSKALQRAYQVLTAALKNSDAVKWIELMQQQRCQVLNAHYDGSC